MTLRRAGRAPVVVLAAWAAGLFALGTHAMRAHWVPLPRPDAVPAGAGADRWAALHVLKADCRCSERVLRHLIARSADPAVRERVLWVGDGAPPPHDPRAAGYELEHLSADELLARYGVTSAPLLVVHGPDGRARYAGGYTARKQGPDPRDRDVLHRLMAGEEVPPLPVFGCATRAAADLP